MCAAASARVVELAKRAEVASAIPPERVDDLGAAFHERLLATIAPHFARDTRATIGRGAQMDPAVLDDPAAAEIWYGHREHARLAPVGLE